jgi:hypothetical protein
LRNLLYVIINLPEPKIKPGRGNDNAQAETP